MKKISQTNVHFDYGGYYSEEHEWISKNSIYGISFKTTSLEEISYCVLVERICRKIALGEKSGKLKLSYSLSKSRRESYIVDDEDVNIFITSVDKEGLKPVLHVELLNDFENNERVEQLSRVEAGSSFGVNYGEMVSNARVNDVENAGILPLTNFIDGQTAEQENEQIIGEDMENVGNGNDVNAVNEVVVGDGLDCRDEYVHSPIGNEVDDDLDSRPDYVELPRSIVENQFVVEWEDGTGLEIGQEFCSKEAVRDLVNRAANKNCFGFETYKSDPMRLILRCYQASEGCRWYLHAGKIKKSGFFSVRVHRKMHTCSRSIESTSNSLQRGTPRLVASVLHEDYPGNLETPSPKNIVSLVQGRLGLNCSYSTAWRGKKQHVSDVRGSPEESYKMLFCYLYMLEKANDGTVTSVELDEENRFKYLFIALGACIEGFTAMRKVIVVDATFLKTVYGGMLVFATAQDGNHHHYPIAFGVIDSEKDVSWNWFFRKLKTVIPDVPGLVFISDRHTSIIKAVIDVYPNALHGHCIWHLSQNVRGYVKNGKDQCVEKFRNCAHVYTKHEFNKEYAEFRSRFPSAGSYLDRSIGLDKWARCHFEGDKYNIDTSNAAESLNSVFKKARKYALLPLIDAIIEKLSEWFNKHRNESAGASETKKVVPFVENLLHSRCVVARRLKVTELNSYHLEYSVIGQDGITYSVDLKMKSCSCRCFDIDKYPCVHAIAASREFMRRKEDRRAHIQIYDLCSKYYLIETWALAYHRTINVVPHESEWIIPGEIQELVVLPPDYTKKSGRNQETRFPSTGERRSKRKRMNKHVAGIDLERWLQTEISDEET